MPFGGEKIFLPAAITRPGRRRRARGPIFKCHCGRPRSVGRSHLPLPSVRPSDPLSRRDTTEKQRQLALTQGRKEAELLVNKLKVFLKGLEPHILCKSTNERLVKVSHPLAPSTKIDCPVAGRCHRRYFAEWPDGRTGKLCIPSSRVRRRAKQEAMMMSKRSVGDFPPRVRSPSGITRYFSKGVALKRSQ